MGRENGMLAVGVNAKDDFGAWRDFHSEALRADGDVAVVADFDDGALAPDVGPPGAARHGAQDGTVFLFGGVPGLLGIHFEFAMDFVLVAMEAEVADLRVGLGKVGDLLAGEEGGEAVLPELVFAFDFAFCLRRGGVAEGNAVEAERLAELSEGVGDVGEEDGMEVHVEFEREAVFEEGGREEIVVGQEVFAFVEFGAGEEATTVVEHVEHGKAGF